MAEYIEREALLAAFNEDAERLSGIDCPWDISAIETEIESAPAADVAPVVHGRWAHLGGDEWGCTNCGEVIHTEGSWEKPDKKFCHECGARMDGE